MGQAYCLHEIFVHPTSERVEAAEVAEELERYEAARLKTAADLRALFLVLFVALILGMAAKSISGGAAGFLIGWASLIFAAALAAFVTAFIVSNPSLIGALNAAQAGSGYGLFVGWIVGIATATAKKVSS